MSRAFEARYGGICGACTEPFFAGDPVRYIDDEVCHNACEERRVGGAKEVVCGRCFLTSCDCDS